MLDRARDATYRPRQSLVLRLRLSLPVPHLPNGLNDLFEPRVGTEEHKYRLMIPLLSFWYFVASSPVPRWE
jgi:hypothetical protein